MVVVARHRRCSRSARWRRSRARASSCSSRSAAAFLWLRPRETKRLWPLLLPAILAVHFVVPGTLGTLKAVLLPRGRPDRRAAVEPGQPRTGADRRPRAEPARVRPQAARRPGLRHPRRRPARSPSDQILDDQWLGILLETGLVGLDRLALARRCAPIRRLALGGEARTTPTAAGCCVALAASVTTYAVGMLTFDAFAFIQVSFIFFILLGARRGARSGGVEPAPETA